MMKTVLGRVLVASIVMGSMVGCASTSNNRAPNVIVNSQGVPNYYHVKSGDTVSEIAQRYRMNYRRIGALNNLDSRYTIQAGQWIKLWDSAGVSASPMRSTANTGSRPNPYANSGAYRSPIPQTNNSYSNNYPNNTVNYVQATGNYQYPTNNRVVREFNGSKTGLGMWFSGNQGDPVYASQSGTVIYAGSGLSEYGNLVMLRHDNRFVTAYAHNSQLLVKEGQTVTQGQQISTMGSTGDTNLVALQFQVRQGGKAINPRTVLRK